MDARSEVLDLLDKMRAAANDPQRVRTLSDQMEILARTYLEPVEPDISFGLRFTQKEGRLFARLMRHAGCIISRQQLMDAMYYDKVGDEPDAKVIDVFMVRVREKLRGTRWHVETAHGHGFYITSAT